MRINIVAVTTVLITSLFTSGTASADCNLATKTDGDTNLLARIDALAACVGSQQARLDRMESTVLISEVPCTELGDGWRLYAPADGRTFIGAGGRYEFGQHGGQEMVTLLVQHMPSHGHPGSKIEPSQAVMQNLDVEPGRRVVNTPHHDRYVEISPHGIPVSIAAAGGGAAHENMPPFVAMYFCKKS